MAKKRLLLEDPPSPEKQEHNQSSQNDTVSNQGDYEQDLSNIPSPSPSAFTIVTRPDPNKEVAKRLWAEDDDISLLKGLARFGSNLKSDPVGFYEFVRPMLSVEVSRKQVMDKVKRLKKKYKGELKKGGAENLSKPHEVEAYELFNRIWGKVEKPGKKNPKKEKPTKEESKEGSDGGVVLGLGSGGFVSNGNKGVEGPGKRKKAVVAEVSVSEMEESEENEELGFVKKKEEEVGKFRFFREWLVEEELKGSFGEWAKWVLVEGFRRVEEGKMEEWEERWRELKKEELGLVVRKSALIQEQVRFVLDILESEK